MHGLAHNEGAHRCPILCNPANGDGLNGCVLGWRLVSGSSGLVIRHPVGNTLFWISCYASLVSLLCSLSTSGKPARHT